MSEKVVTLPGARVSVGTQAAPEIVDRLKSLLERAERGEIRAFGIAYVEPNNRTCTETVWASNEPTGHTLAAGIAYLFHNYIGRKVADNYELPTSRDDS